MLSSFASPLLVFLEAIVSPSSVDGNKIDVNEAASFLLRILRAIKMAEDAVDSSMTLVSAVALVFGSTLLF